MPVPANTPYCIYEPGVAFLQSSGMRQGPFEFGGSLYVIGYGYRAIDSYSTTWLLAFKSIDGLLGHAWQVHAVGDQYATQTSAGDGIDCVYDSATHTVHSCYFRSTPFFDLNLA